MLDPPYDEDFVRCQNRALIQLCRSGNIRTTQMDSGSAVEILPSGDMVAHCEGNLFTAQGEISIKSSKNASITVSIIGLNGAITTKSATGWNWYHEHTGTIDQIGSQQVPTMLWHPASASTPTRTPARTEACQGRIKIIAYKLLADS